MHLTPSLVLLAVVVRLPKTARLSAHFTSSSTLRSISSHLLPTTPPRTTSDRLIILRTLRRMSPRPWRIPAPIRRQRVGPVGRPDGGHLHGHLHISKQPAPVVLFIVQRGATDVRNCCQSVHAHAVLLVQRKVRVARLLH